MIRVGLVLGDLNGDGAPWNYFTTLAEKLHSIEDVEPICLYTDGDYSHFPDEMDFIRFEDPMLRPRWHKISHEKDIDLFHLNGIPLVGQFTALRSPKPVVATAHSVLHWLEDVPVSIQPKRTPLFKLADRISGYSMDRILTVSSHIENILHKRANVSRNKITTTYEGVSDVFYDTETKPRPDDLPPEYLFHLSKASENNEIRKNIRAICRALRRLHDEDIELPLILAGRGWQEQISDFVDKLGLSDSVRFPGYVSQDRLLALYDHSDCFVFPSWYEGFGLPNVEAMARGTPVVTSSQYAISEVVGDCALTIQDCTDDGELADAIKTVLEDVERNQKFVRRAKERAERFRWGRHVRTIRSEYRATLDRNE